MKVDGARADRTAAGKRDGRFTGAGDERPEDVPELVLKSKLLKEDGVFVFEHGKQHDFSQTPGFVEHRAYGSVNFSIFKAVTEPPVTAMETTTE